MRRSIFCYLLSAICYLVFVAQIQITHVDWKPAPPTLPKGTQVAVLEGDPKSEGLFTMRIKLPAGSIIPPHWHPRDERVTVLSGRVIVGFGDKFEKKGTTFRAGGFYVNPPNVHHFLWIPQESVLQLTCVGPWELHVVEPLSD
jgi:quercetin dioxygenase-like cupin family protein